MTHPIVRFAPSPTGRLHIGNIRTALLNWLYATRNGGQFILRLDDTDRERSTDAFAAGIREDLEWLGLVWVRDMRQSDRLDRYREVADLLRQAGRLYACYESEDELERRRKRQLALGQPPIYDRAALRLAPAARQALEAEGRTPHWRFRLDNTGPGSGDKPEPTLVAWPDLIRGEQTIDVGSLSDPVLIRGDGTPLYTFTSVVDDIDLGITHVIRGEDHVTNTGVQIQIFDALGAVRPRFAHHSLLVGSDGKALSKRLGDLAIEGLRRAGLEPMAVASHAALLGTPEAIVPYRTLTELASHVDLERVSRSPGRFDPADLEAINAKLLHALPYDDVAARLAAQGIRGGEPFWLAVRGNLAKLSDAARWWRVVTGPLEPSGPVGAEDLLARAAALLPMEPWDETTFGSWSGAVRNATGVKGRDLFHPLRLALTGAESGPELKLLMPLIGAERVAARLRGETA